MTITAENKTVKTGLALPTLTFIFSGFVNGENESALTSQPTISTAAQDTATLCEFAITVSVATSSNYAITHTAGKLFVIDKTVPVITWSNPAAINYGTPLSAIELNATADTPGSFTYTPPLATALNAGTAQTLSVSFAPEDTQNFAPTSATVQITVNKMPLSVALVAPALKLFGTALPQFAVTYAGFVNNDTAASLGGTLVFNTEATSTSPAGNYTVTPGRSHESELRHHVHSGYAGDFRAIADNYSRAQRHH